MTQVLVVYRRSTGTLIAQESLGDDLAAATRIRFEREMRERTDPDVEVVVLSSSSDDVMQQTHGRYFKDAVQLWSALDKAAESADLIKQAGSL